MFNSIIDEEYKLFNVIRDHFTKLVRNKDEDSKLFWATYSIYVVEEDKIYLCSRISDASFPICDVKVTKSDKTEIEVTPIKLSGVEECILNKLDLCLEPKRFERISPLEVMGWEEDLTQNWKGEIQMRGSFTGWNTIECIVDKEALNRFDFHIYDEIGDIFRFESPNEEIIVTFKLKYLHEEDCCEGYCSHCSGWLIEGLPEEYLDNDFRRDVDDGEARDYDYPEKCFSAPEVEAIIKLLLDDGYE